MSDDLIGKKIGGYEILDVIGRGGMATVYRALQTSMNRTVALKILPSHFVRDDTYLQRFEREVKIVAQLEHRNIVPVHDYGEYDKQPYIAMRYLPGGSVNDLIAAGPLPEDKVLTVVSQIAPALDYAHSKNVLHRDLKPSNVLLDDGGGAYITDFGIARILGTEGQDATITTQGVVGTPSYMSPEQAQGKPLDGRSDVYSLGVMLFEMMTGRRPFISDTPYGIAVMQVTSQPPLPRTINPKITGAIEQVILKSLKKKPENRYPTAVQLAEALRLAIERPDSIHDTKPRPVMIQPAPVVPQPGGAPVAATPPSSQRVRLPVSGPLGRSVPSSAISQRVPWSVPSRRQRHNRFWVSIAFGGIIGCGLLSAVGLFIVMAIGLLSETGVLMPTAKPVQTKAFDGMAGGDPTRYATAAVAESTLPSGLSPVGTAPATGIPPDYDPEAGMIVYFAAVEGNFDIYQLDLRSGEHIRLTDDEEDSSYPLMSPDGTRLAFQSNRDGDFDIYVIDMATGETRQLTDNDVLDRIPSWSPDGEWVVYSSETRGDGSQNLYRIAATGGTPQLVYSDGQRNSHPRYSHDGRYIIFTGGGRNDAATWEILRLDLQTGELLRLTDNDGRDASPVFSLDDRTILYNAEGEGWASIATIPADGSGEPTILYDGPGFEWGMSYSLDGQFIVFNNQVQEASTLHIMRADGSDAREITTEHGGYYPSWMP